MAKEVAFTIKIQESGDMKKITANADELAESLNKVKTTAEGLKPKTINFAQLAQGIV